LDESCSSLASNNEKKEEEKKDDSPDNFYQELTPWREIL